MGRKTHSISTVLLRVGALGGLPCTAPLNYAKKKLRKGNKTLLCFLLAITLISSSVFGPIQVTSAMMRENGTNWWTVEELLEFYKIVEEEKETECGDNQDCKIEFGFNMIEKGPKYSALNNLLESQIWITSINPTDETVKVLFFDDDMMLRHMGIEEKLELEHLYIGWFEEWNGQIYNYDHDSFTNGSTPGSHPLYDSTVEDLSAIVPWEEVELSVAGGNLIDNPTGKLDYAVFAKYNMFNAQGHFDYSNCLNAPDYTVGMECQMMVSGDQWVSYFPPREQINESEELGSLSTEDIPVEETVSEEPVEPETIDDPLEQDDTSEALEHQSELITTDPELTTGESLELITDVVPELSATKPLELSVIPHVKVPETGKSMQPSKHGVEVPWWLGALGIVGLLGIVWWSIPTKSARIRHKIAKSQKNHEKLLTKTMKCDKMGTV